MQPSLRENNSVENEYNIFFDLDFKYKLMKTVILKIEKLGEGGFGKVFKGYLDMFGLVA